MIEINIIQLRAFDKSDRKDQNNRWKKQLVFPKNFPDFLSDGKATCSNSNLRSTLDTSSNAITTAENHQDDIDIVETNPSLLLHPSYN